MKGAKDKLPGSKEAGVVYALGCVDCPMVYVGETCRTAEQRVKEHRAHLEHGRLEQSAVAKHVMTEGHAVHWEPFIVEREQDQTRRRVLEALTIHRVEKGKGTMNTDNGMQISRLWLDLAV